MVFCPVVIVTILLQFCCNFVFPPSCAQWFPHVYIPIGCSRKNCVVSLYFTTNKKHGAVVHETVDESKTFSAFMQRGDVTEIVEQICNIYIIVRNLLFIISLKLIIFYEGTFTSYRPLQWYLETFVLVAFVPTCFQHIKVTGSLISEWWWHVPAIGLTCCLFSLFISVQSRSSHCVACTRGFRAHHLL